MDTPLLAFPPSPKATSTNVYTHGGDVAQGEPIHLIYWGHEWETRLDPSPGSQSLLADSFTNAVRKIVEGPWLAGLRQYGVKRSLISGATIVPSDPPLLPNEYDNGDIEGMINQQLFANLPVEKMYVIFLPQNTQHEDHSRGGAHTHFHSMGGTVWYGYVCTDPSFEEMMRRCSHEISEMCSDPEDDAWKAYKAGHGLDEIGDICQEQDGRTNGVWVESYWSNREQACIIPTAWSIRHSLAWSSRALNGKGLRSLQPGSSIRNFLYSA